MSERLVYLDNAATSFPKPQSVIFAINQCLNSCGNPGRSSHALSVNSAKSVYSCRETICSFFSFDYPENVVFTYNTTHALNLAIMGLYQKDSEIIISNLEHNSVLRPVHALSLQKEKGVSYKTFDATGDDNKVIESFTNAISNKTQLAVITMCSNVTGKLLPIEKISQICKMHNIKLIYDAAQCAGIIPLSLSELYFSAICFAGHKSLYGIMGLGFCIFSKSANPSPSIYGGNGTQSLSFTQQGDLPERLEAGTCAVPAIVALDAGIKHISHTGQDYILDKCTYLENYLRKELLNMPKITLYGLCKNKVSTLSFNIQNQNSENVAQALSSCGFCVRGGFHCSALAHTSLGTIDRGGTVRVSISHFNTKQDIVSLVDTLAKL